MNNKIYEKPYDLEEASNMLMSMSGRIGFSIYGVCILNTYERRKIIAHRTLKIQCKKLERKEIDDYVLKKPVTEWAAAYNPLDDESAKIFQIIDGYEYGMEYGIPISIILPELERVGIKVNPSVLSK